MGGFLQDKATEMLTDVMEEHGIKPGELNQRIEQTLDIIVELAPVAESMAETSQELEDNVDDLYMEIRKFNENSGEMVEALNGLEDTLEKFAGLLEDLEEES